MSVLVLSIIVVLAVTMWPMPPAGASARTATVGVVRPIAAALRPVFIEGSYLAASANPQGPPRTRRAARDRGYRDPLKRHRATVGPDVRISLLIRIRALILLVLIIAAIGTAIAGVTLVIIASGRFVLEFLAG